MASVRSRSRRMECFRGCQRCCCRRNCCSRRRYLDDTCSLCSTVRPTYCLKPRPHQQQCRSNIVECCKSNDSFAKVETNWTCSLCFDFVDSTKFYDKLFRRCCRFWQRSWTFLQQSRTLLRYCCWCDRDFSLLSLFRLTFFPSAYLPNSRAIQVVYSSSARYLTLWIWSRVFRSDVYSVPSSVGTTDLAFDTMYSHTHTSEELEKYGEIRMAPLQSSSKFVTALSLPRMVPAVLTKALCVSFPGTHCRS